MIMVIAAVGLLLLGFWVWAALTARRWQRAAAELDARPWPRPEFNTGVDSDPHRLAVAVGGRARLLEVLLVQARRRGLLDVGAAGLQAARPLRRDAADPMERLAAEATAAEAAAALGDPSSALREAARAAGEKLQRGGLWRGDAEYAAYRPLRREHQTFPGTRQWTYVVTFLLLFLLLGYESFTGAPMLSVIIFALVPWPLAVSWWLAAKVQRTAYRLVTERGYGYRRILYIRNAEPDLRAAYAERYIKDLAPDIATLLPQPLNLADFDLRVALFGTRALKEDRAFQRQVKKLSDAVDSASAAASRAHYAGAGAMATGEGVDLMLNDYPRFGDGVQKDEITATAHLDKKV